MGSKLGSEIMTKTDKHARRGGLARLGAAAVVVATPLVVLPATASAATTPLPKSLAQFAHCPISNPAVSVCLASSTGGAFQIGKASLTFPSNAVVTLGLVNNPDGSISPVAPTDGTPVLTAPPVTIPVLGGLINVTASAQLAGVPTLSLAALLSGTGTAITLPLTVGLSNPLLGSSCVLGTASAPLTLNLTAGTTNPPPPNTPVTGSKGTISAKPSGLINISGVTLVDNAFAAPGASGCGPFGLFNGLVNGLEGLPAAAGTNSATLSGTVSTAPAKLIRKYLG